MTTDPIEIAPEITPEMIEAAVGVLVSYDPAHESEEEFAERFIRSLPLYHSPAGREAN